MNKKDLKTFMDSITKMSTIIERYFGDDEPTTKQIVPDKFAFRDVDNGIFEIDDLIE